MSKGTNAQRRQAARELQDTFDSNAQEEPSSIEENTTLAVVSTREPVDEDKGPAPYRKRRIDLPGPTHNIVRHPVTEHGETVRLNSPSFEG